MESTGTVSAKQTSSVRPTIGVFAQEKISPAVDPKSASEFAGAPKISSKSAVKPSGRIASLIAHPALGTARLAPSLQAGTQEVSMASNATSARGPSAGLSSGVSMASFRDHYHCQIVSAVLYRITTIVR